MKSLAFIHRNDTRFAVGDFYPVLSVFSYHELGNTLSPLFTTRPFRPRKNCTVYKT
ncbi:Pirin [Acinetobacter nosocomialis]|nr:Pirin [Acinetobacter nosocomialis]SSQ76206.1 Pirin [Acinetobacter nosocomialis]SSR58008.1 Pirin [Acinetobacter nosocomialis]